MKSTTRGKSFKLILMFEIRASLRDQELFLKICISYRHCYAVEVINELTTNREFFCYDGDASSYCSSTYIVGTARQMEGRRGGWQMFLRNGSIDRWDWNAGGSRSFCRWVCWNNRRRKTRRNMVLYVFRIYVPY